MFPTRAVRTAIVAKLEGLVRSAPPASTVACVGACGYFIGLALPLSPPFDLPLAFLIVLATVAASVGLRQSKPPSAIAVVPVLGFVAARLLSSLVAPHAPQSVQVLAPFLPALLLFYLLSEWVETRRQIVAIYVCLTITGFVLATTLLAGSWLSDSADVDAWARAASSPILVVKNDITLVAVLAPLALAVALFRPERPILLAVLAFLVLLVTVIVLVQSRTAFLTSIVGIACFAALAGHKALAGRARLPLALLAGFVAIAFVTDGFLGFGFLHKVLSDWQGSGRLALWAAALAMFQSAPLLGHGPSGYGLHYRAHLDALQLPAWIGVDSRVTPWAHNLYLEVLAEQGVVGLLSFVALSGVGLVMLARIVRSRRDDLHRLGAGAGAAFIAFLTAALFELSFLRVWVTIIFFTLFGLLTTLSRVDKGGRPWESR